MVKIVLRKWCLKNIWLTENNKVLILSSKKRKSTEFDLPQQMLGIIIQTVKMKLIVKVTIISVRMPLNLVLNSSIVMPPLSQSLYGVARFKFSKTILGLGKLKEEGKIFLMKEGESNFSS